MSKVVIIDYHLGNMFSVRQALDNIGIDAVVSESPEMIRNADALVLPGVGAFGDAMNYLRSKNMVEPILESVASGKPFLGICLGLQLLFTESEEFGSSKGLNLIPGQVKRFSNVDTKGKQVKVPQIAWNEISPAKLSWENTALQGLDKDEHMYFVHSYYVEPQNPDCVLTTTNYCGTQYASAVSINNIFACQFHPEKSGEKGLAIYKNWAEINHLI